MPLLSVANDWRCVHVQQFQGLVMSFMQQTQHILYIRFYIVKKYCYSCSGFTHATSLVILLYFFKHLILEDILTLPFHARIDRIDRQNITLFKVVHQSSEFHLYKKICMYFSNMQGVSQLQNIQQIIKIIQILKPQKTEHYSSIWITVI